MTTISLDTLSFSTRGEDQLDWVDQLTWQPIGQRIRYALQGNVVITENVRAGRPITLVAEEPWCWLSLATVNALVALAQEINQTHTLTWRDGTTYSVRFRRDTGPLELTPINALKQHYTGTVYLIEV